MFTVKAIKSVGVSHVMPKLISIFESEGFKYYKGRGNFERTIEGVTNNKSKWIKHRFLSNQW